MSIERAVREELRAFGLVAVPQVPPPMPSFDIEAERTVIASMWDTTIPVPDYLRAEHFFAPLHSHLFTFLTALRARGETPSPDQAVTWLETAGLRAARLAEQVEELAMFVPAVVPLLPVAHRLITLSRRRMALLAASRFVILLSDLNSTDDELRSQLKLTWNALRGVVS